MDVEKQLVPPETQTTPNVLEQMDPDVRAWAQSSSTGIVAVQTQMEVEAVSPTGAPSDPEGSSLDQTEQKPPRNEPARPLISMPTEEELFGTISDSTRESTGEQSLMKTERPKKRRRLSSGENVIQQTDLSTTEVVTTSTREMASNIIGRGIGKGGVRKNSHPKKDDREQRTENLLGEERKREPPSMNKKPSANKSNNIKKESQKEIAQKTPRNPVVAKALKKSKESRKEKLGVNKKGVVPLTTSSSGNCQMSKEI